jgi:hypothetical protein
MTTMLPVVQIVVGAAFAAAGGLKAFAYDRARAKLPWVPSVSKRMVQLIGVAELLGALGLILPWATGIAPVLTPAAGLGLIATMVLAAGFHAARREPGAMVLNAALIALIAFVTYGRWA